MFFIIIILELERNGERCRKTICNLQEQHWEAVTTSAVRRSNPGGHRQVSQLFLELHIAVQAADVWLNQTCSLSQLGMGKPFLEKGSKKHIMIRS
jgi:hypothetical protein